METENICLEKRTGEEDQNKDRKMRAKLILVLVILILVYVFINRGFSDSKRVKTTPAVASTEAVFVNVACGLDRVEEVIVSIKSALIFSSPKHRLKFIVVSELELFSRLEEKLESFKAHFAQFSYSLVKTSFPDDNWTKLFKPCAAQRLFLSSLLLTYDKVVYIDSDTLFLSPPHSLWEQFSEFNASQLAAMTTETESENIGWYPRFARHPFYGKFGLNSGVMLMDLKKMREVGWERTLIPLYEQFKSSVVFGDQDLVNIYFSYHPHQLHLLPCEFNYRPDSCMYGDKLCLATEGIRIIHGNRGFFHREETEPIFSQLYSALRKVSSDTCGNLICFSKLFATFLGAGGW